MVDRRLITLDDVARALEFIYGVDDRDTWLQMGMAIRSEFGDVGFDVWDTWSQRGDNYKAKDARAVWKSFKKRGVGIGTLIKAAQDNGFKFSASELSDEDKQRRQAAADQRKADNLARRQAEAQADKESQETAVRRAHKIWLSLPVEGYSPYLARKQIHGFGCRYGRGNSVVVPVFKGEQLVGLQFIQPDGDKKFLTGTAKSGASFIIRPEGTGPLVLCTGYATSCSIGMALPDATVVITFDDGNLVTVADQYADSDRAIIIAADNDHAAPMNSGLKHAKQVVDKYGWRAVWPDGIEGKDFNDLHVERGIDAVQAVFMASKPQAFPPDLLHKLNSSGSNGEPPRPPSLRQDDDSGRDPDWQSKLKRRKPGKDDDGPGAILPLSSNIELILNNDNRWRASLAYCDFSYRIIKQRADLPHMQTGEWKDEDTARLTIWLSNTFGFEPARAKVTDALIVAAQANRFHPVRDYLAGLVWDGTPRINDWLSDIYEASASDARYLQEVGAKFLIGAVARVMAPGCKMDNVMILEGRQGLRKSTSIARLFGDWFSDAPIPIGDKDAYQNIQGVWCSELAELDSFNKAESTSAKLFFSQVRDRYRPSYGVHAQDFPRQTIFVGTTNQGEYLKDYTGNRRYWPVKCNLVRLDLLEQNRDQYWAEAMHRYQQKEPWWVDESVRSIFEDEQDERMQVDPWEYPIQDYLNTITADYVTADGVLTGAIEKDIAQITRADQNRVSPIMRKLGWANTRKRITIKGEKVQRHVYIRRAEGQSA